MKDFRDLIVWSKSHELTLTVYKLTEHFPKEEMFGLKSQIRPSVFLDSGEYRRRMWAK